MNDEQNLAINSNRHSLRSGVLHLLCGAIALLVLGDLLNAEEGLRRYEYLQIRMGIPVQITLYADREDVANRAADAAYDRFRELDRILSDYDPDSELMRFCAASAGTCVPLSPELMSVLTQARQFSQASDGAFDVTVGPVVKLWRVARRRKALPDEKALAAARELVDWQQVRLDAEQQTGALLRAGMRLDLGAIAKGYAADEALRVMKANGVAIALIDAGGDLTLGDPPPGRAAWSVVIEPLQTKTQSDQNEPPKPVTLQLKNCAVATSGDAYQHVEIDGVRYSHIVDPHTGLGLTTPSSVTVIAPTGLQADALASTLSVLGPTRGLETLKQFPHCEAHIVQLVDEMERRSMSAGFAKHIGWLSESD